jgi:hypothetical protein
VLRDLLRGVEAEHQSRGSGVGSEPGQRVLERTREPRAERQVAERRERALERDARVDHDERDRPEHDGSAAARPMRRGHGSTARARCASARIASAGTSSTATY